MPRATTIRSLLYLATLLLAACAAPALPQPAAGTVVAETQSLRGTVSRLEPRYEPTTARQPPRAFALKGDDGRERTFRIAEAVNIQTWNILHLNSHLVNGEPILVIYQESPDGPVAIELRE